MSLGKVEHLERGKGNPDGKTASIKNGGKTRSAVGNKLDPRGRSKKSQPLPKSKGEKTSREDGLEQGQSAFETKRIRGKAKNGGRTAEMVQSSSSIGIGEKIEMQDGP